MEKPARILYLIARLNIGGPAIQVITLSSSRLGDRYETLLVCGGLNPGEGDMSYLAVEQGIQPYVIKAIQRKISLFGDLRSLWVIRKIIKRFQPQIIHTHTAKAGTLGRVAALTIGIPFLSARKFRLCTHFTAIFFIVILIA
ncbi:MAG: glycosyltransferase [Deltaproteobacteria bacterium]|nr:glycosyltransferase [Deltaproteobacteria bacterium]